MKLRTSHRDATLIVHVETTALDADCSDAFREGLSRAIGDSQRVVLDLESLALLDSSGLGAILTCLRDVTAAGGELKLAGLHGTARAVCDLARLHRVLDIHDALESAVDAFGSES